MRSPPEHILPNTVRPIYLTGAPCPSGAPMPKLKSEIKLIVAQSIDGEAKYRKHWEL